jgi:hypothetical protein
VLEKRRFQYFAQHWQGFFEVKYQLFTTPVFLLQVRKVATFLRFIFLAKNFRRVAIAILKQLLLENLLRFR